MRCHGYGAGTAEALEKTLNAPRSLQASELQKRLLAFVRDQSALARPGEHLIACSDVIESVFGKFKNFEGEHARSGFSSSILSIAAMVAPTTADVIRKAMETIHTVDIRQWASERLGRTVQSVRKRLQRSVKSQPLIEEQIQEDMLLAA